MTDTFMSTAWVSWASRMRTASLVQYVFEGAPGNWRSMAMAMTRMARPRLTMVRLTGKYSILDRLLQPTRVQPPVTVRPWRSITEDFGLDPDGDFTANNDANHGRSSTTTFRIA